MTSAVTREGVLAVVDALRAAEPDAAAERSTALAVRAIIDATTASIASDDRVAHTAHPTSPAASVAGVLIDVTITRRDTVDVRSFAIVALAATEPSGTLAGSVLVTGLPLDSDAGGRTLLSKTLSGGAWVSGPIDSSDAGVLQLAVTSKSVAPPAADAPPPAPTRRTAAERAAARKRYEAALRSARAKYVKARKKARSSKRRRKVAKAAYDKRRARAKAAYRAAIADVPAKTPAPTTSSAVTQALGVPTMIISTDAGWAAAV